MNFNNSLITNLRDVSEPPEIVHVNIHIIKIQAMSVVRIILDLVHI